MKSRDLIFILIVVVVVGGLYYLSTRNKARAIPSNPPEHLTVRAREDCLKCHLPAKFEELERQHKHPGKWRDARVSCLLCHKAPNDSKAQYNKLKTQVATQAQRLRRFSNKLVD